MGNYAKKDARAREMHEQVRRIRIVKLIPELNSSNWQSFGLWIFCIGCGRRMIADAEWTYRRLREVEAPIEDLAKRLACSGCRNRLFVRLFFTPYPIDSMRMQFSREWHDMLLSEPKMQVE